MRRLGFSGWKTAPLQHSKRVHTGANAQPGRGTVRASRALLVVASKRSRGQTVNEFSPPSVHGFPQRATAMGSLLQRTRSWRTAVQIWVYVGSSCCISRWGMMFSLHDLRVKDNCQRRLVVRFGRQRRVGFGLGLFEQSLPGVPRRGCFVQLIQWGIAPNSMELLV